MNKEELVGFLQPIHEEFYGNNKTQCLSFENLTLMILETVGNPNIVECVNKHCEDLPSLSQLLSDIHKSISERKLKMRITKIKKAIKKCIEDPNIEDMSQSDCSSISGDG